MSLDTVGSDATGPNTAGIDRTCPISARQSPPIATAIARSTSTFPGSCTASGLRHGSNAADIARSNPTVVAVVTSSTDPPIDTTRCPEPATRNDGYNPVGFRIRKVLRFMQGYGHQIPTFLQVRAPFPMINTPSRNSGVKARG